MRCDLIGYRMRWYGVRSGITGGMVIYGVGLALIGMGWDKLPATKCRAMWCDLTRQDGIIQDAEEQFGRRWYGMVGWKQTVTG